MKLFTKAIEKQLQAQFPHGSSLEKQQVICRIFDPLSSWTWYILNQDPKDTDYLWAIVQGHELEVGSVSKRELEEVRNGVGLPLERDRFFTPLPAAQVFNKLKKGELI